MVERRQDQRVSVAKKLTQDWYIPNADYWVSIALSLNDKSKVESNIRAANGIIDSTTYDYILRPLTGSNAKLNSQLPGEIRDVDFITPIRENNIGDYINLPFNFNAKINDPDATLLRDSSIAIELKQFIEDEFIKLTAKFAKDGEFDPASINIEEEIDKIKTKWFEDKAIKTEKLINLINDVNNMEDLRVQLFTYWWMTEEFYTYRYIKNNELFIEAVSPVEGFTVSNDNGFVEDHEAFVWKRKMTMTEIEEHFGHRFTDSDRTYLEKLRESTSNEKTSITVDVINTIYGRTLVDNNNNEYDKNTELNVVYGDVFDVYIIVFITYVDKYILHYVNEIGEPQEREVDSTYKLDKEIGDIEIEKLNIPEVWNQVRIGDKNTGIYLKPEPEEVQRYTANGHVKIPFGGKKGILDGIFINPIPQRIAPSLALHRIIGLQIERNIAKYKGTVELIPISLMEGDTEQETAANYHMKIADNTILYDPTKVDFNTVAQGYRVVGNDAISNYISTLIEYRDSIKAEAWDMANMNDARAGATNPYSTVRNNEQNLYRAKLGSTLMTTIFNSAMMRDYEANYNYARAAYGDTGKAGAYIDKTGNLVEVDVTPDDLLMRMGIFVTNSKIEEDKLNQYKEIGFAAGQNGDFDIASAAIEADNAAEMSRVVRELGELKREFEMNLVKEKNAAAMQIEEKRAENLDKEHDYKIAEIREKELLITDRDVKIERIKAGADEEKLNAE